MTRKNSSHSPCLRRLGIWDECGDVNPDKRGGIRRARWLARERIHRVQLCYNIRRGSGTPGTHPPHQLCYYGARKPEKRKIFCTSPQMEFPPPGVPPGSRGMSLQRDGAKNNGEWGATLRRQSLLSSPYWRILCDSHDGVSRAPLGSFSILILAHI